MIHLRRAVPLAAFLLFPACRPGEEVPNDTWVPLASRVLTESEAFGRPADVLATGSLVVVSDGLGGPALHVVAAETGELLGSFGRKGEGPGEFQAPRALSESPGEPGVVWLHDLQLKRVTEIDAEAAARGDPTAVRRSILFRAGQLPLHPVWTGDGFVSTGIFAGGRLARMDTAGVPTRAFGPLPPTRDGVPTPVVQHAFTGTLARARDGRLALAARHSDRIDVYAPDGALVRTIRGPLGFEPVFEVAYQNGVPYMASGDDLRFGYLDVAVTDARIVALHSGRTRKAFPGRANVADEVHVFDWEGRLLRRLRLDHETLTLALSPEGRRLYTVRREPTPALVAQDLPEF